ELQSNHCSATESVGVPLPTPIKGVQMRNPKIVLLLLLSVLALQAGSPLSGQTPVPPAAQVEAVKKLDLWVGEWKGTGWASAGRDERHDFTIVEKVQRKVGGSVLLIEGRGTK